MSRKWFILFSIIMMIAVMGGFTACGDSGDSVDGDEEVETGPIMGDVVLGDDERNYEQPHVIDLNGETTIIFRNQFGIFSTQPGSGAITSIFDGGSSIGVNQYAVDDSYFVWNTAQAESYRHQWALGTTAVANTGPLVPGFCVRQNSLGDKVLSAANSGGDLYNITLSRFTDQAELNRRITLLDPDNPSTPIKVAAFACEGNVGLAGTDDGRLMKVDLNDNTPTLEILIRDERFRGMKYSHPYLGWIDANGDIKYYNVQTGEGPGFINVDPVGRANGVVEDMRLFQNFVVWSDDSEGNYNVWLADLASMENENDYIQVTKESTDERFPFLYKGMVYWQDNRNERQEIWSGEIPPMD